MGSMRSPNPTLDPCMLREERKYLRSRRRACRIYGYVGKDYYRAPEIYARKTTYLPGATDIFAVGVCMFIMVAGRPLWRKAVSGDPIYDYVSKAGFSQLAVHWELRKNLNLSKELIDLIDKMIQSDPKDRPSA